LTTRRLRAGSGILLKPEVCIPNGQLSDGNLAGIILKAVPLDRAECGLVIVYSLRGPTNRQPLVLTGLGSGVSVLIIVFFSSSSIG
jgi:hypothetical protein